MTTEEKVDQLIKLAHDQIAKPYQYATQEGSIEAFDCSSFIQYLFQQIDISLPRSALLQAGQSDGQELDLSSINNFQAGDLVFMRSDTGHYRDDLFAGRAIDIGHVALMTGPDEIIHAKSGRGVIKQKLSELISDPHYKIVLAKRLLKSV
ncbi:MAG: hypothetical protein COX02_01650 [Candidatus Vogelbacteria bacterium CG22_combo_CG10-13_8_21_14_all_37_9]|uniref:NlpC/P60 domain-containing protein n=1 Tax=Candidatus Vogelbacteria bacterium CG22_combo_CG10-13_8_21_14_all_37_9 TaxID=1975046 RepID=A0A2H0BKJ5_9BACT|nr:MAG: hypothetical protein COX02_01650 [Candidatus Vogelbacteria bacterium CG22_combo_CG10-13_8_21_14_all_37_9]